MVKSRPVFRAVLLATWLGVLPPPPHKVVLKNAKGDVTLDHLAHNARRTPCASCHGPGVVGKIEGFDKQRAHTICFGCHREQARGPRVCSGCHGEPASNDG